MAGWIGRSIFYLSAKIGPLGFSLHFPTLGRGEGVWGMHNVGGGSEATGRARKGGASRAMAGRIGRSIILFEREIGPLGFSIHFPTLGRGESVGGMNAEGGGSEAAGRAWKGGAIRAMAG